MKTSMPTITQIETKADVQAMRDATGDVMVEGEVVIRGIIGDTPQGVRRFPDMDAALAYLSETLKYGMKKKAK
jgi:hypothetical protein